VTSVEKETNDNTLKGFTEQTVYMSELLMTKYPDACNRLIGILEKHSVKYAFLKGTKDIWCRRLYACPNRIWEIHTIQI